MRKKLLILLAVIAILLAIFFAIVPAEVEKRLNTVINLPPYAASEAARALHKQLLVADLHADSLPWGRDLLVRSSRGHVDVPRLIEGNVALQAFTVFTKVPFGLNIERNDDSTDQVTLLALGERWPMRTWTSLKERALYQARRLHQMAAASGGKLTIIESAADLGRYLERRRSEPGITAGFLGIEGAQVLEGNPENVDVLFDAGFRMMGPTHFFDNEMGGSAHGVNKGGLTEKGKEMVTRVEARRMLVDLAHASPAVIDDVLAMTTRPVVVSHTGVKGRCDNTRNLSDDQLTRIAATGGVIGIGFWETATCGRDARAIARAIKHAVELAGIDHVALGSDFDGAVQEPFDATGLVQITDALLEAGFDPGQIRRIMGENVLRLLSANLQ
jgi:microsomal dipeptidase-like Zn-dependent dipeptidase